MQAPGQVQLGSGEGSEGSEKVWEALVQSQVRLNRAQEKVPEKVPEALVQSHVRFNRVPEKVLEKIPEKVGAVGVQGQVIPEKVWEAGSGEGSGEGPRKPCRCKAQSG